MERIDDWDKVPSFCAGATPRRSTRTLEGNHVAARAITLQLLAYRGSIRWRRVLLPCWRHSWAPLRAQSLSQLRRDSQWASGMVPTFRCISSLVQRLGQGTGDLRTY